MDLMTILSTRYTTKKFNPSKKIASEDQEKIINLLKFSASSTNIQPWHFIIANDDVGKKRITKATQGFFIFNEHKIIQASHVVVFACKNGISEDYLSRITEKENSDGRYSNEQQKIETHNGRKYFVDLHKNEFNDLSNWIQNQVYLNLGSFLLGVAALGIDAVPMEGFNAKILDKELGLTEKGYSSLVIVALGYHADDDFNASLPKSRLDISETIEII